MTINFAEVNANAAATKDVSPADKVATPKARIWSAIAKRFWTYTEATSQTNTKSFEGLL